MHSVYVIGIPAYFFIIYYLQYQSHANSSNFRTLKKICSTVVAVEHQYKSDYQFFMVIQLLQKLCLVAAGMFFTRYKGLQTVITVALLSLTLEMYRKFKPYKQEMLNTAEMLSVLSSIIVLALGLAFLDDISNGIRSVLTVVILSIIAGFTIFIAVVSIHLIKEKIKTAFNSRTRTSGTIKARGAADLLHT
ncbi:hypothetical protein BKA69DRAFT_387330 [Paraphysoderma sedebokerense]|nr:hypothetical protein BKA69DRAFT_387330 [Paraphysoderma sedebokerense]